MWTRMHGLLGYISWRTVDPRPPGGDEHDPIDRRRLRRELERDRVVVSQARRDLLWRPRHHGRHAGRAAAEETVGVQGAVRRGALGGEHAARGNGNPAGHLPRLRPWWLVGWAGRRALLRPARVLRHAPADDRLCQP